MLLLEQLASLNTTPAVFPIKLRRDGAHGCDNEAERLGATTLAILRLQEL